MERSANHQMAFWIGGLVLGAAAMYLTDPADGKRRRAGIQARFRSLARHAAADLETTLRDSRNRLRGVRAEAVRVLRLDPVKPLDDHVLAARVRSRLGRKLAHPHALQVEADRGRVTLRGRVTADEQEFLLLLVRTIPGVGDIRNRLSVDDSPPATPSDSQLRAGGALDRGLGTLPSAGLALLTYLGVRGRSPSRLLAALTAVGLLIYQAQPALRALIPAGEHRGREPAPENAELKQQRQHEDDTISRTSHSGLLH
jgi:hypothetical protein